MRSALAFLALTGASFLHAQSAPQDQNSMPGMDMSQPAPKPQQPATKPNSMADMPGMDSMDDMPGMQMPGMNLHPKTLRDSILNHTSSGTSAEPISTPTPMLMRMRGQWMLMLHGEAFVANTQQQADSPRNRDAFFSTNWVMPMAMRSVGKSGQLTLRAMFSLEPATVPNRNYPELFQQGETAFGRPIVDGQHPHDFFMEVAALYDQKLGSRGLLSFYAAPVGDPAIGPTAYPHRLSASEDPIAALGHHQEDSTHIAFNVLTAGATYGPVRLEASGFHGGEPSEQRWGFEPSPNGHAIDSYSGRLTVSPTTNLSGQYSAARIASPEALYPGEDQVRQTASVMYNRPFGRETDSQHGNLRTGNWSSTLLWGRTKTPGGHDSPENSYLAESLLKFRARNYVWTRLENAGRSNELLLAPGTLLPRGFQENPIGHVAAYTVGYDRDFPLGRFLTAAPGGQFTSYTTPKSLVASYGAHPSSVVLFVRFRLQRAQ